MNARVFAIDGSRLAPTEDEPLAALQRFYAAFNGRDLVGMADNWSHAQAASMSNPLGGLRRGWAQIKGVYENIFLGPAQVYVEFYDYSIDAGDGMFCTVGRERGYLHIDGRELSLAIRTTRIYRREQGAWAQLHHHGSMDDPQALAAYQRAVLGA